MGVELQMLGGSGCSLLVLISMLKERSVSLEAQGV